MTAALAARWRKGWLRRAHIKFSPHAVSVILHGLDCETDLTGDMFDMLSDNADDRARWEKVSDMMDQMRARFGGKALSLGVHHAVPGGYVGGKIAFGCIPEAEDFEGAMGDDSDTHFCTFLAAVGLFFIFQMTQ
ncbi:MAG: hypothetical protein AAFW64_10535 [Pseudomonadota bacterium]